MSPVNGMRLLALVLLVIEIVLAVYGIAENNAGYGLLALLAEIAVRQQMERDTPHD